jgi:hypothetical protein
MSWEMRSKEVMCDGCRKKLPGCSQYLPKSWIKVGWDVHICESCLMEATIGPEAPIAKVTEKRTS